MKIGVVQYTHNVLVPGSSPGGPTKLNIKIIDVYNTICPMKNCSINQIENNILVFRDKTHLTKEGTDLLKKNVVFKNLD